MLKSEHLFLCNLVYDGLGKPLLLLNDALGPNISFSHCNEITWAALASSDTDVGIDAERAEGFGADYPFRRVFHIDEPGDEFTPLLKHNGGNRSECAALLWSAKEAFVKALGCAFHLFSPLEVNVVPLALQSDRALLLVQLSDKGLERLVARRKSHVDISSFRIDGVWVSVAVANRHCIC
jgi:phosphopantetheinyl transferase